MPNRISTKICDIDGCSKKHYARGYCLNHYRTEFYNVANRERTREIHRQSYLRHREKQLARHKLRRQANKGTPKSKYAEYRHSARRFAREFSLTMDEFMEFWKQPCHYCDAPIATIGLDRLDNNIGYIKSNLAPCCTRCNKMKKAMNYDEFINLCKIIAKKVVPFAR